MILSLLRAHPRMRGENQTVSLHTATVPGSSPHARGKPEQPQIFGGLDGLIPACAGKTGLPRGGHSNGRAHPRMRGENADIDAVQASGDGSSPHARGKHHTYCHARNDNGLIPACAGKTLFNSLSDS